MAEETRREENVTSSSNRSFGLVLAVLCGLVAALKWWNSIGYWQVWLGVGGLLMLAGLFTPRLLDPLKAAWTRFWLLLRKVASLITMALIFYSGILPIALFMRLFGKASLDLSLHRNDPRSYWIARPVAGPRPETMRRQF